MEFSSLILPKTTRRTFFLIEHRRFGVGNVKCGLDDKMQIVRNLRTFAYFNAKTNPKTETPVLGRE